MEKYPVFVLELDKGECRFGSVDEIIGYFKSKIEEHPVATFIAIFDHYSHTKSLPTGIVAPQILDAKNIVFCFGQELPNANVLAVRPRSIGVCDVGEKFVISFLEAPNPKANEAMESWAGSLRR